MTETVSTARVLFVIPCFNEACVLRETVGRLTKRMSCWVDKGVIGEQSGILLVDDGSSDGTWSTIKALHARVPLDIMGLKLSHNVGHQHALLAGMAQAVELGADAVISLDADLQDDLEAISGFLTAWRQGAEIVYGVRSRRVGDTVFKRHTALAFYRAMSLLGVELVPDHADYRLLGRRALEALGQYGEVNVFLRGIVPKLGFQTAIVSYERQERFAGESKYPLRKMLEFAINGITSFSIRPIRFVFALGCIVCALSVLLGLRFLWVWHAGITVPGWTSVILSIWFLGGVQLLSIGVVGEYVGRIYYDVRARPRYFVQRISGDININNKIDTKGQK